MTNKFFMDSYALIEILKMSQNYSDFVNSEFIMTKLNLFEVYYRILRDSEDKANIVMKNISDNVVDFDDVVVEEACKFKLAHKTRRFSMADCIGYIFALKAGIKFLTGDKGFENMPNVEFVK